MPTTIPIVIGIDGLFGLVAMGHESIVGDS